MLRQIIMKIFLLIVVFLMGILSAFVGGYLSAERDFKNRIEVRVMRPAREPAKKYVLSDYIDSNKYLIDRNIDSVVVYPVDEYQYGIMSSARFMEGPDFMQTTSDIRRKMDD